MATDRVVEDRITQFFLTTCDLHWLVNENYGHVYQQYFETADKKYRRSDDGVEYGYVPLITGSVAELYVKPLLPCVGDVDVMCHRNNQLAVPAGYSPPAQLPGEFGSRVEVYLITDSEFPGYVYLWSSYLLTECADDGKYSAVRCEQRVAPAMNGSSDTAADDSRHGPALVKKHQTGSFVLAASVLFGLNDALTARSVDKVFCMRCLSWPPQAADWPTRRRNFGWPDSATVRRVVGNGCDVVGVAHRRCRKDEWTRKHQWRLSFSRAEIALINSWTPVQQIVYHMLRVFVKTERLTDSAAAADKSQTGVLSNYHVKTLMLWACELKSGRWWTDDLNLVRICVRLLHTLAAWLTDHRCQHYFINNCNLFGHFEKPQYTEVSTSADRLTAISRECFRKWCIDSYIQKFAQLCPRSVSSLLQDAFIGTPRDRLHRLMCLHNAISAVVNWRLDVSQKQSVVHFLTLQKILMCTASREAVTRLQRCYMYIGLWCRGMTLLGRDKLFKLARLYGTAVLSLHAAYKTTRASMTDEMLDVLATACLESNDERYCHNARRSSVLSLSQAATLMKVVANSSRSTVQQIEIELSKAYLHRALSYRDSNSKSVYCLANVYLAVLNYASGQYQTARDHCALVTRLHDHTQCGSRVVQGELLPRINAEVDNVLGLTVFYVHIRAAALNEAEQRRHVGVFATELFAHYFHAQFLSVTKCRHLSQTSLADERERYRKRLCHSPTVFVTDVILFRLTRPSVEQRPPTSTDAGETRSSNASKLAELLQRFAVEHLTTCRELEARDFDSVVTPDFKALYAYKSGQYRHCLRLSVRNVGQLIANKYQFCLFVGVSPVPELIQLLDDEIVSVVGLGVLANRSNNGDDDAPPRQPLLVVHQLTLSLYLIARCQIVLRHAVTSLATTLGYVRIARSVVRQVLKYVDLDGRLLHTLLALDRDVLQLVEQLISRCVGNQTAGLYVTQLKFSQYNFCL